MQPDDLIEIARELVSWNHTRQAYLKRAMSTAYYAMFHTLCKNSADSLVGPIGTPDRSRRAWNQAYRAVEYGNAKKQCKDTVMEDFPETNKELRQAFREGTGIVP